jgi:uncharacterized protein (TIGR00369 family)
MTQTTTVAEATPASGLTPLLHAQMPLTAALGLRLEEAGPDRVVVAGDWAEEHCTAADVLHGGYVMALADSAGAVCAALNLPKGATTSTIESKTNFLRAVRHGAVSAVATPLHAGATTIVVQVDVLREDGRLAARTTATQAVVAPRSTPSTPSAG